MEVPKEEQVQSPVKLEFINPYIVEISSSSEKSSTWQPQEIGEEATSSLKRSTLQQQFSAENLHKKPRLYAHAESSLGDSVHLNMSTSYVADGIALDDAIEDVNLQNDDIAVDDAAAHGVVVGKDDLPDDFLEPLDSPLASSPPPSMHMEEPVHGHPSSIDMAKLMFKQFWKAGDYDSVPLMEDLDFTNGMEHVRVHPKFLHSNATSHKWALGAIAELLDNSLDEAVNGATHVNVEMICNPRDGRPMLMIEDDGGGMDPERMRQCMSLGYSVKSKVANTIGQYGNGFKTSTMRLGADVVVFSRRKSKDGSLPTQSIGLLSYTFLTATGQDDIIVPMVDYEVHPFGLRKLVRGTVDDWNRNLETLLQWSPYNTEKSLFDQFMRIDGQGTVVIVYNLWEDEEGNLELDFDADPHDIQLRGANRDEKNNIMASKYLNCKHFFTHKYSLRSYASILYLRLPKMFKMSLRGKQVVHHKVVSDLMLIEQVKYKPVKVSVTSHRDAVTEVTLGFVKDAKEHIDVQGFNVYHKNRLIKPFWRVWNYPGIQGRGIFGVLEANFVEPAHDKQGFERTTVFARLEARLIEIQKSYWSKHCEEIGYVGNASKKKAPLKAGGAGNDPPSEQTTVPCMPSHVPVNTRVVLSLSNSQKSTHTASVVLEKDRVQAGQPTPGESISSLGTETLPSLSATQIFGIEAASHAPPFSGNKGRVSSTQSLAELGAEEDDRSTAVLHTSAASTPSTSRKALLSHNSVEARPTPQASSPPEASTPSTSRKALLSHNSVEARPTPQASMPPEALTTVDRLKITPCVRVTRSQALEEKRAQGKPSPSVPTVDLALTYSAEALSRNGDNSELHAAGGSNDGLEVANKSTSLCLLVHTRATIDKITELSCATRESDSKGTQTTTYVSASKDYILPSNYSKASGDDVPRLPDGNQVALVSRSGEGPGLHTSSAGDLVTVDASRPSLRVCQMSDSRQDSNEALISPSSQCEAPDSSQCTRGNAANGSPTETQTQGGRLTRSMLQLRQSHAKAAQLESANLQKFGNKIQQPVIDGPENALCLERTTPEEGDALVAIGAERTVSLESIKVQQPVIDGTTNAICLMRTTPEEGDASVSTLVANGAENTVSLESIEIQQPVIDCTTDALCLARTTIEQCDLSVSTLVANGAEHSVSLESIDTLEEKIVIMKQRLGSLQVDLEQIYSERDFLKGELEEERRRQSLVEEELKKRLQAVSLQARELEAANKLLQVCQR